MSDYLLEVSNLAWSAPDGKEVLSGACLALKRGESVWLSGPSGGGKSTLLRLLNMLISPHEGSIFFQGKTLDQSPPWAVRRKILLVGQTPALLGQTIGENLKAPFSFRSARDSGAPAQETINEALDSLGLADLGLQRDVKGLSVGQLQRMCLCRALLLEPPLLLLDEPLAPLDPKSADLVQKRLAEFAAKDGSILMVSHQKPVNMTRHLVLSSGRVDEAQ